MSALNKSLSNEIYVSNMYDKLGYFTRFHINIYPLEKTTKQLSDIDVLAIKFDESLFNNNVIIEVKEQSNKFSDLFKLYGFKTYFGNSNSVFITKRIHPRTIPIAESLEINILSFNKLKEIISDRKIIDHVEYNVDDGLRIFSYLDEIKKLNKGLFWNYHYIWVEKDPYIKLYKIQKMFESTNKIYKQDTESKEIQWFRKELFITGFIAVLEISSRSISIDEDILQSYLENKLLNIGIPLESKQKIKSNIDALIDELQNLDLDLKIDEIDIYPKYLDNFNKLIRLLIKNAKYAQKFLLKNESIHRLCLKQNGKHISEIMDEKEYKLLMKINTLLLLVLHNGPINPDFSLMI